jgi:Arc/MetJ family transcription regulator
MPSTAQARCTYRTPLEQAFTAPAGIFDASTPPLLIIQQVLVYFWCMARTNVDIDDEACAAVMRRYRLATKRDAINFALRTLAAEPLALDEARKLRGTGWVGDLDEMRADRTS